MAQSKHQYYKNGVDSQQYADITIDLRRADVKEIRKWTPEQKKAVIDLLPLWRSSVDKFFQAIEDSAKQDIVSHE